MMAIVCACEHHFPVRVRMRYVNRSSEICYEKDSYAIIAWHTVYVLEVGVHRYYYNK